MRKKHIKKNNVNGLKSLFDYLALSPLESFDSIIQKYSSYSFYDPNKLMDMAINTSHVKLAESLIKNNEKFHLSSMRKWIMSLSENKNLDIFNLIFNLFNKKYNHENKDVVLFDCMKTSCHNDQLEKIAILLPHVDFNLDKYSSPPIMVSTLIYSRKKLEILKLIYPYSSKNSKFESLGMCAFKKNNEKTTRFLMEKIEEEHLMAEFKKHFFTQLKNHHEESSKKTLDFFMMVESKVSKKQMTKNIKSVPHKKNRII